MGLYDKAPKAPRLKHHWGWMRNRLEYYSFPLLTYKTDLPSLMLFTWVSCIFS